MTKQEAAKQAYKERMMEEEWQAFGTLSFRNPVSIREAERRVQRWIGAIRKKEPGLRSVTASEIGKLNGRAHVHVLLSGLKHPASLELWRKSWERMNGNAKVQEFIRSLKEDAVDYVLKDFTDPRTSLDLDLKWSSENGNNDSIIDGEGSRGDDSVERGRNLSNGERGQNPSNQDKQSLPKVSVKRNRKVASKSQPRTSVERVHIQRVGNSLVVVLPLKKLPKESPKSLLVASTHGLLATGEIFRDCNIVVNANAMIFSKKPQWRIRAFADIARLEGRLGRQPKAGTVHALPKKAD